MPQRCPVQQELQRHKAHLDELFGLAPDAIVLTDLSHPRIIRVNREFTRMFGYASLKRSESVLVTSLFRTGRRRRT